jgi:HEAT repeat protein
VGLFGGPNIEKLTAKRDLKGLAKALTSKDLEVRDAAARALIEIGDPAAAPEIVAQLDGQRDEAVIDTAAGVLRSFGDASIDLLKTGLHGGDDDERPLYSALLGRMGEERGLPPLAEATRDGSSAVRATAALGLGVIRSQAAADRLVAVFSEDDDMDVRGMACLALASNKLPGAYDAFSAALQRPEPVDRALGATGLGMLGDARAAPALDAVTNGDDDERVRDAARKALAELPQSA